MSTLDDNKISVDRRAALRAGSAAVVGLTVSTLPTAAAAASGDDVGGLSAPETTVAPQDPDTIAAPEPRPPVLTATASMTTLSIGTDRESNAGLTYHYQVASGSFVDLSTNSFDVDITSSSTPLAVRVEKRNSGVLDAASLVTITKVVQTVTTASGGQSLTIADSTSGTRGVSVVAVGGRGGRGGNDQGSTNGIGGAPANPGRVEATYDVPAGAVLVARAGTGGVNGQDGVSGQVNQLGGAGGTNGLRQKVAAGTYNGARGGHTNQSGGIFATRAGGGGGGGAASVLQVPAGGIFPPDVGIPLVVAAGSGGGGGAEAEGTPKDGDAGLDYSPSNVNTGSTTGTQPQDRTSDRGGHGAGGGGYVGGSARTTDDTSNRVGRGGYTGQSYAAPTFDSFELRGTATTSVDSDRAVGGAGFVQLTYWTVAIGPA